jgi:lipoprotein-releasing system permease protein
MDEILMYEIPHDLKTVTVQEQQPEIFSWLEVLDMNVIVIIGMMILVSVINMASALLIIILERTSMIGALKAFGIQDFQVVQIFLYHAFFILGRGMLIGNLIALAFAWLQVKFHIISLDPDNYYVKEVPVKILWQDFAFLNLGTLLISLILLIIPALYVTTIAPARAVRFD